MYSIAPPSETIAEYVDSYWSHFSEPGRPSDLKIDVFVDAYVDLVINLGCSYGRRSMPPSEPAVDREIDFSNVDFQRTIPIRIIQKGMIAVCGIRFKPGGLGAFCKKSLHEFTNHVAPPSDVFGSDFRELEAAIAGGPRAMADIQSRLDGFLEGRLNLTRSFRTFSALKTEIENCRGTRAIAAVCEEVGLSARTAERLFKKHMGLSPKLYARIARFQTVLNILMEEGPHNLAEVAAGCDYSDQSHLVKDFKELAGGIPARFKGYFPEGLPRDFAPNVVAFLQD